MVSLIDSTRSHAQQHRWDRISGYGPLVPDRNGLLDLPRGFQYRVYSREGDAMTTGGLVPGSHDGMAAFPAGLGQTWLVRNHEINVDAVVEDGIIPVPRMSGITYDPEGVGGTSTLLIDNARKLAIDRVSLAGTIDNGSPFDQPDTLRLGHTDSRSPVPMATTISGLSESPTGPAWTDVRDLGSVVSRAVPSHCARMLDCGAQECRNEGKFQTLKEHDGIRI